MTFFQSTDHLARNSAVASVWASIRSAFERLAARHAALAERRRAIREMARMEDWQLRDIGLNRGDVSRLMQRHGVAIDRIDRRYHQLHL